VVEAAGCPPFVEAEVVSAELVCCGLLAASTPESGVLVDVAGVSSVTGSTSSGFPCFTDCVES
jgi:hypothetical protein